MLGFPFSGSSVTVQTLLRFCRVFKRIFLAAHRVKGEQQRQQPQDDGDDDGQVISF